MPQVELIMPKMGESIMEATILKWLKKEGDNIKVDESILEIATDKVDSEVPSSTSGVLVKILHKEGEVVPVGKAIAIIDSGGEAAVKPSIPSPKSEIISKPEIPITKKEIAVPIAAPSVSATTISHKSNGHGRFYSPLVKNIAKNEGISVNELETVSGTGKDGRVSKKDILSYLQTRKSSPSVSTQTNSATTISINAPVVSMTGNVEIIEMDRMRKLIAEHMVMSKHVSPHVTSFVEADVTNLVVWRNKIKDIFEKREGEKMTFTPLFIEAVVKAIKDFPMINSSVSGTTIVRRKDINIGMAAALPSGNLIVPVIKNTDQLSLVGLTKIVNDLAGRARQNKLKPNEIEGGTFTLTNVGTFGNVMGTPIINQPQAAILATGAIRKKPAVIETPQGDLIGIRHMMFLSLSYDHRIIDGALGGSFLRRVADYLEQFDAERGI